MTDRASAMKKSLDHPDEVRRFEKGVIEMLSIGDVVFGKAVFQPGWRWSDCVKPLMGTDSCQVAHKSYLVSGALHVRMDDGDEMDLTPGDVFVISPGHDAWVVGSEPCVMYDFGSIDQSHTPQTTA